MSMSAAVITLAQDIANGKYTDADIGVMIAGINEFRRRKVFVSKATFNVGDKVEFVDRSNGLTLFGTIQRIMAKNIKVKVKSYERDLYWIVNPTLLKKVA